MLYGAANPTEWDMKSTLFKNGYGWIDVIIHTSMILLVIVALSLLFLLSLYHRVLIIT